MVSFTINFDPSNQNDYNRVLEYILSQPCMSKQREAIKRMNSSINNVNSQEVQSLKYDIREQNEIIKRHEKENEQKEQRLRDQETQILSLKKSLDQKTNEFKAEKDKLEKNLYDALEEVKKVQVEKESKLNQANKKLGELEQQFKSNLSEKDREIRKLRKQLENYSVSFGTDDPSEKIYFGVSENGSLEESMISSISLYCANRKGDIYRFSVNTEDGPIKNAISNYEHLLLPFCEIIIKEEAANTIHIDSVGQARVVGSQLNIITKAKISLIKQ